MWSELRKDIEGIRRELNIPESDFRTLPYTTDWHLLEERIYSSFRKAEGQNRPYWLWDNFNYARYWVSVSGYPDEILNQLVPTAETVWFLAYDGDDFVVYQGKVEAIQKIIPECTYLDEYYLINKKYEWLLCVNHHDSLVGTGEFILNQLQSFAQRSSQTLTQVYPG